MEIVTNPAAGQETSPVDFYAAGRIAECLRREAGVLSGIVLPSIALREADAWDAYAIGARPDDGDQPHEVADAIHFDGLGSVAA